MISTLLLLCCTALAGTELSAEHLDDRLRDVYVRLGEPYLIGASGEEAERAVIAALKASPGTYVEVVRMPTIGDQTAEMQRVMKKLELRCGLFISPGVGGGWVVNEHGECRPSGAVHAEAPHVVEANGTSLDGATDSTSGTQGGRASASAQHTLPSSDRETLWQIARLEQEVPDPNTALLQSTILGFGTGHFYSGNSMRGKTHLGLQAGGILLSGLGALYRSGTERTEGQRTAASVLVGIGGVVYLGDRVVDIYTAPMSAHESAEYRMRRGR
jgi:hypothetical protein